MKLIKEICQDSEIRCEKYELRKAVRTILLNAENEVALLNVSKFGYYKLPGGGIENNEKVLKALVREVKEEVGANISILNELGIIIEYRNTHQLLQVSYCFVSTVKGKIGKSKFTEEEINDGFSVEWHTLPNAIKLLENTPNDYLSKYITGRDSAFLNEYKTLPYQKQG